MHKDSTRPMTAKNWNTKQSCTKTHATHFITRRLVVTIVRPAVPQISAKHCVASDKIDPSYMVSERDLLWPTVNISAPVLALSFPMHRNFSMSFFPVNFSRSLLSKNCVSIFFTRLLHRHGPLRGGTVFFLNGFEVTPLACHLHHERTQVEMQ